MKKGKAEAKKKQGKGLKELIPPGLSKPPRETTPLVRPEASSARRHFDIEPFDLPTPWPGDEVAAGHNFSAAYQDTYEYTFPRSVYKFSHNTIEWRTPEETVSLNEVPSRFSRRYSRSMSFAVDIPPEQMTEETEKSWEVITSYYRDEVPEEFEERKQAELARIAAAKKKVKPEEILPKKVKEVKAKDLEMGRPMPQFIKWMTSQLQVLKDANWRDANNKGVWNRIFPQQDGVPVFNPNGKYWVKLLHHGSEVLVEIDHLIPVNRDGLMLLPRCSTIRDIWPILLSKAYLKLHSQRWKILNSQFETFEEEIDGSFIYSLTGLLPQHFKLKKINEEQLSLLNSLLTDEAWVKRNNLVMVYCSLDRIPEIPAKDAEPRILTRRATFMEEQFAALDEAPKTERPMTPPSPTKEFKTIRQRLREVTGSALSVRTNSEHKFAPQKRPCHVIPGFSYLLFEVFSNSSDFDMMKITRDEKLKIEEEARTALLRARAISPARKLKKHQSPARYRDLQKRKKRREKEKEERRAKLLEVKEYPVHHLLHVKTAVTNTPVLNIECIFAAGEVDDARVMHMNRQYYLQTEIETLERAMEAEDRELFDPPDDSEEIKVEEVMTYEEPNLLRQLKRAAGGAWVASEDFTHVFDNVQVCFRPDSFPYKLVLSDLWTSKHQKFKLNEKNEVFLVTALEHALVAEILTGFAPAWPVASNQFYRKTSLLLQQYDFETESDLQLASFIRSYSVKADRLLLNPGEDLTFRPIASSAECGYTMWICSTVPVVTMSRTEYLMKYREWRQQTFTIDYPSIQERTHFMFFKFEVLAQEPVILKLTFSDHFVSSCVKLFWVDRNQEALEAYNREDLDLDTLQMQRFVFPSQKGCRLILEGSPPCALPEGQITLEVLSKNTEAAVFTQIDHVEPIEISDSYYPNKYGIIFQEHLFVPDEVILTIHVRMKIGGLLLQAAKGKEAAVYSPERGFTEKHKLILELYANEQCVLKVTGEEEGLFSHLNLVRGPEYLLVCKYDLDAWEGAKVASRETEGLNWVLRIFASDTVGLVKDTRKEDKEEALRKSWETAQPGRAEQAKTARARYLAKEKQKKGLDLTDAENNLLKETWQERRKARKDAELGGKPKPKGKEDKKKVEEPPPMEVTIPSSSNHVMDSIRGFLDHLAAPRKTVEKSGFSVILSNDEMAGLKQELQQQQEASVQALQEIKTKRDLFKSKRIELIAAQKAMIQARAKEYEGLMVSYKETREDYRTRAQARKEIEAKLKELIKTTDTVNLEAALTEANHLAVDGELLSKAADLLKRLKVTKYNTDIRKGLETSDQGLLRTTLQALRNDDLTHEIDARLIAKATLITSQ
mmetsp:Transcript_8145/g.16035  ORF Transcript_8145/g.16035 Transcript_8145/m.16035 type:complete len:1346 (+) Transcript_8145:259-4296(+)